MNQGKKLSICALILVIMLALGFSTIPQATTPQSHDTGTVTFALSSWDFPDDYGQGIDGLKFYENSTGSWVAAPYYTHYYPDYHEELGIFYYLNNYQDNYFINWTGGVAMKIRVYPTVNTTLLGTSDPDIAKNYVRHNVTVLKYGTLIFSQQNFTYVDNFYFECVLNFLPQQGEIYTITIIQEIYY